MFDFYPLEAKEGREFFGAESTRLLRTGLTPGRLSILFEDAQGCHRPVVMVLCVPNGSVLFQQVEQFPKSFPNAY